MDILGRAIGSAASVKEGNSAQSLFGIVWPLGAGGLGQRERLIGRLSSCSAVTGHCHTHVLQPQPYSGLVQATGLDYDPALCCLWLEQGKVQHDLRVYLRVLRGNNPSEVKCYSWDSSYENRENSPKVR